MQLKHVLSAQNPYTWNSVMCGLESRASIYSWFHKIVISYNSNIIVNGDGEGRGVGGSAGAAGIFRVEESPILPPPSSTGRVAMSWDSPMCCDDLRSWRWGIFSLDENIRYQPISDFVYSRFHTTLPKSSLQIHWISVRFYKMGDR